MMRLMLPIISIMRRIEGITGSLLLQQSRIEHHVLTHYTACRFPESGNSSQFWSNLINGKDMVTKDNRRWPAGLHDTPARFGKLLDISSFDAMFFSVHGKQAQVRDTKSSGVIIISAPVFRKRSDVQ